MAGFVSRLLSLDRLPSWDGKRRSAAQAVVAIGTSLGMLAVAFLIRSAYVRSPDLHQVARIEGLPRQDLTGAYVSSAACRDCHQIQYESWYASFHRQMTQPATPAAVRAPFEGEEFDLGNATARLSRRGDEFLIELADHATGARRARRVVLTTGAHHMQGFWVARGAGNLLDQLPLMWLVGDDHEPGRWVPIGDSFLTPPGKVVNTPWNSACIFCHSVGGRPRLDVQGTTADTTVAELGIACEACHGPGRQHVEFHRRPATSQETPTFRGGDVPVAEDHRQPRHAVPGRLPAHAISEDTIVQPARLPPQRSAQVCGHCHSVATFAHERGNDEWRVTGSLFRPGDDLNITRRTLLPARLQPEALAEMRQTHAAFLDGHFWPDGMIRVAGREYNGLVESACYQQGGMTCVSCHSLHQSDPNDQLAAEMEGNHACYQCHDSYRQALEAHTHHASNSSGSLCYNCHMPHTTYGLFKGIRSHQITSPSVAVTLATGRPNACNLCHLDQTLQWASQKLTDWYAQPSVDLDHDDRQFAAGVLWLLRGDAVQRILAAYAAGQEASREASGDDWLPPFLAQLLDDPYAAVRRVAEVSLARLGYPIDYDFTGSLERRAAARRDAIQRWQSRSGERKRAANRAILQEADGRLEIDAVERLAAQRDDRPVTIQE